MGVPLGSTFAARVKHVPREPEGRWVSLHACLHAPTERLHHTRHGAHQRVHDILHVDSQLRIFANRIMEEGGQCDEAAVNTEVDLLLLKVGLISAPPLCQAR